MKIRLKLNTTLPGMLLMVALWVPAPVTAAPDGMVEIPAGCFMMGSDHGEGNEKPVHKVCLDAFYMDVTEVTQAAYEKVIGHNPSGFKGSKLPVERVAHVDATEYCKRVGKRLPTEAEWEKAARGGSTTEYYWGSEFDESYAWVKENAGEKTHPVGLKKPNQYGLYDMLGNVWEWTSDFYDPDYYKKSPKNNPKGAKTGSEMSLRGGSWYFSPPESRSANRKSHRPGKLCTGRGFRCAR